MTRPIVFQRNSSFGNSCRWIMALKVGLTPHAQPATPAMLTNSERKSAWFSSSPFIHGRPL
jgi:hypothetical protein